MPAPLHILVVARRIVPSTVIGLLTPFAHLKRAGQIEYALCSDAVCPSSIMEGCDLVIVHRGVHPGTYRLMQNALALGKPVLYDVDDLLLGIPQDHPLGAALHRPSVRRSIEAMHREATCIKAGSPYLAAALAALNPCVVCHPFAVDTGLFQPPAPATGQAQRGALLAGYGGSRYHNQDIASILPAFASAARRLSRSVTLELWGVGHLPAPFRYSLIIRSQPFIPDYIEYARRLAGSGWTMGVAPLVNVPYNMAKSNVKFRDFAAAGIPAVYSAAPPYDSVQHGVTGLLAKNLTEWMAGITALLGDRSLRSSIAAAARRYVVEHHSLTRICALWLDLFIQLVPSWLPPAGYAPGAVRGILSLPPA